MIRIFIGCAANHEDAESQAVLEWSIAKHASEPFELRWMKLSPDPASPFHGWDTRAWATPFSGFRWAVPALCGFEGQAIYLDSDVIVLADIAELWRQAIAPGRVVMAKAKGSPRFCVSLWDCAAAEAHLPGLDALKANPNAHAELCRYFAARRDLVDVFSGDWNCLDGAGYRDLGDPDLKAIHYTAMRHQPHLRHAVPRLAALGRRHWFDGEIRPHWRSDLVALFDALLEEAEANGYPVERYETEPLFGPYRKRSVANVGAPSWADAPC